MTLPAFVLGATVATLFGAAFHLWRGGGLGRLLLLMGLAWGGVLGGALAGRPNELGVFSRGAALSWHRNPDQLRDAIRRPLAAGGAAESLISHMSTNSRAR